MNRTKGLMLVSLLAIAVVLTNSSTILTAIAQNKGTAPGLQLPPRDPPWMSQLTDDQKTEIQQLTQSMKDSGASQEEIRDALEAKLQEWGIQLPEDDGGHHRPPPWVSQLTDDQKTQIEQMVQSMRDSGATPQEIGDAVNAKLQEWGIQLPELSDGEPANCTRPPRDPPWMSQLTDDQKAEIEQLVQSMKDSGATQQEIMEAINAKLQEWGIEVPPPPQSPGR